MSFKNSRSLMMGLISAAAALTASSHAFAVDEEAAKAVARQNNCFKCHAISKDKDGPAWQKVAAKYKGKADAHQHLYTHLTTGEKAKFPDGHEEDHKIIKAAKPEIDNLVDFILSR